jgi:glutamate-ammonia-ligase adenylyltransferase
MDTTDVRDVLLAPRLEPEEVAALLRPYGFSRPEEADRELQRLAEDPTARARLARYLPELLRCLSLSADPDQGLSLLERFVRASLGPLQILTDLGERPLAMELVTRAFGASPFMAEILIRHPAWFHWITDPAVVSHPRSREEIAAELDRLLAPLASVERRLDGLRIAHRRGILHIGVRDLLRHATVEDTLQALSALADVLIQKAYELAEETVRHEHGLPPPGSEEASAGSGFVVLAMGKLGGEELNFSSDVDLVYVYDTDRGRMGRRRRAPGRTSFYLALARRVTAFLGESTGEGNVYRVDLRLRPEGRAGSVAHSVRSIEEYYRTRGRTWERLALVRARPVAGDLALGERVLERVRPFVYGRPFEAPARDEVRRLKEETDREVARRGETARNVKLGTGGIREIEFLTQVYQLRFGGRRPRLRVRHTLAALAALADGGFVRRRDHDTLRRAYLFLRDVENKLQMVADAQVHALPASGDEIRRCALRLGYRDEPGAPAAGALLRDHLTHTEAVHRIFSAVFSGPLMDDAAGRASRRSGRR